MKGVIFMFAMVVVCLLMAGYISGAAMYALYSLFIGIPLVYALGHGR